MNTHNVNNKVNTAAQEPSERYGLNGRTPDFAGIQCPAYTNSEHLTVSQVYDLFQHVCAVAGKSTGSLLPPVLPPEADYLYVAFDGCPDSLAVWLVDGWPQAASDEMSLVHWSLLERQ